MPDSAVRLIADDTTICKAVRPERAAPLYSFDCSDSVGSVILIGIAAIRFAIVRKLA